MRITLLFLIFLTFLFTHCDSNTSSENSVEEASFNVVPALISEVPIEDEKLGFKMNTPKGWGKMDDTLQSLLNSSLLAEDYDSAYIKSAFINPKDSSMLLILDISNINNLLFSELNTNYEENLNRNKLWVDIQFQKFNHNCFEFDQYVLQNENLVNFNLIAYSSKSEGNGPFFEVRYLLNRKFINENIRAVESSIGSIDCF